MTRAASDTDSRLRALLAPTIASRGDLREVVLIPLAAVFLALVIGALIMMATSVAPATILKSFVAMADGSLGSMNAISER